MKRLTKRIDGKAAFVHGTCYDPQQVCDFLAAYEDTGLEPEEIKQMCALARLNSNIFDNDFGNHIAELIVAEQDGRLVVLPCKVGDTVYAIADCADILKDCDDDYYTGTGAITCPFGKDCEFEECDDANRRVFETYVGSIYKDKDEPVNIFLDKIADRQFYPSDFGKTVFLTRAQAEDALVHKLDGGGQDGREGE